MTKAEEVSLLRRFVESVPADTYLHGFLAGAVESFSRAVAQDYIFPTLAETYSDRATEHQLAQEEFRARRAELEALRRDCDQLARTVSRKRDELDEIRRIAGRLASV